LVLRIFVAAPDDVQDEVSVLSEVVEDLNRAHSRDSGIRLEIVHWRADVVPALGNDPQAIINEEIGAAYDIFVGILWTRFGTPTPRAKSGFEEEFNSAYERYQKDPSWISVMLYFKTALIPLSIDLDHLKALRDFQSRIKDRTLYCTFSDRDDFASQVRLHLTRHIQSSAMQKHSASQSRRPIAEDPVVATADMGEEGYLDLIEIFEAEMRQAVVATQRISELQNENTTRTELNTKQLQAFVNEPEDQRNRLFKQLFNIVAGDLNNLAKGLNEQAGIFENAFATAMEASSKALGYQEFWHAIGPQQRASFREALEAMDKAVPVLDQSLAALAGVIADLPRVTTMFNRSKKNAIGALDHVRASLKRALSLTADLRKGAFFGAEALAP
jgi:hypothetical protein